MMKKLLLADDSITIQKVVGIIFSTEEYQLEMTDDGNSAFDKALAEIPDLVIADISMPGKDGFELCRAIKSEPSLSNTSVLLLPGAFDHFDETKAGEVCADGWLTKPFESQALLDKVSQLLEAEPVRMAGVAVSVAEETSIEAEVEGAESDEDSSVGEAVLGHNDMDELEPSAEEIDEESPDDIWDAVSFAEDDLQKTSATDSVDSEDEVSFVADVMAPSEVNDVVDIEPATDEQVLSAFRDEVDEVDSPVAEVKSGFVDEEPESSTAEELQPEPFVDVGSTTEENIVELSDQVESDLQVDSSVSTEESEPVDFSFFSDAEKDLEETATNVSEESTDFVSEFENDEPLELAESDSTEQNTEVDVAEVESVSFVDESVDESDDESDDDDAIMELSEEDEQDEFEPIVPESIAAEEGAAPFAEIVDDVLSEDDEILDLSVGEIVEDEVPEEETVDETAAEEIEAFVAEDTKSEPEPELELETESEHVDDVTDLVDEEIELVEEVETLSAVAAEEDFYFDATAEDDEAITSNAVAAVTAGAVDLAAGVAATHLGTDEDVSSTEHVEKQLRELSEDELKEVVAKVAGPLIEKLAAEMVEKIAWEVVPDLAEAMISAEIRKIKEGE